MAKTTETPASTKPEIAEGQANDPTLGVRRLLAWVIAFALGGVATVVGFYVFPAVFGKPPVPLDALLPISVLNIPLLPLTALPFGLFFLIWIDYFMGTKILPD